MATLRASLADYKTKYDFLKTLGFTGSGVNRGVTSSPRFFSPQYRKLDLSVLQIGYPRKSPREFTTRVIERMDLSNTTSTGLLRKASKFDAPPAPAPVPSAPTSSTSVHQPAAIHQSTETEPEKKSHPEPYQPKILLLADEHGKGMNKLLKNVLGNKYNVESVIKPYATLDQVLNSCTRLSKDYTKNDFVLIAAGSNDKDPLKLQSMLYYNMNKLTNTNVILCSVGLGQGKYLNERKINSTFKLLCSRFEHTSFLEIHDGRSASKLYACRLLRREVLKTSYKCKFSEYQSELSKVQDVLVNVGTQTDYAGADMDPQVFLRAKDPLTKR